MLRKLFAAIAALRNLIHYAVDLEITTVPTKGRPRLRGTSQLHIGVTTHYGGLSTDVYIARWRGVQVYSDHLAFYAGRLMLRYGTPVEKEWNRGFDSSIEVEIGPFHWTGWESYGAYAERFSVFGRTVAQRVA